MVGGHGSTIGRGHRGQLFTIADLRPGDHFHVPRRVNATCDGELVVKESLVHYGRLIIKDVKDQITND